MKQTIYVKSLCDGEITENTINQIVQVVSPLIGNGVDTALDDRINFFDSED